MAQPKQPVLNFMLASVLRSCTEHSARNAFYIEGTFYTYGHLAGRIAATQQLLKRVMRDGEMFIGIIANDDFHTYGRLLGILFSGVAYVPLNARNPVERSIEIIRQAGIKTLFASKADALTNHLEQYQNEIQVIYSEDFESNERPIELPELEGEEAAYMLFTSGSTGIPKGVPISFHNLENFIDAFFALGYKLDENDRFLQMFDLTFDLSVMSYLIPLTLGACVYTVPESEIKYMAVYQLLEDHEITFALMVPSILSYLRSYFDEIRLEKLRYSAFCGEALHEDVTREWSACIPNARIQNVYGPTEATIFCLSYDWTPTQREGKSVKGIVSIGKPMKHTKAIVVGEQMKPVKHGEQGELCLAGGQITAGYWSNPAKNREAFFTHEIGNTLVYYRTGDSAYVDADDDFVFCGRIDNQVKIHGYRVELHEIEHHARQYGKCRNVVAVAYENQLGNTSIHLFLEDGREHTAAIIDFLKTRVPYYMIPAGVTSIEQLPLNSNGKTDRKKLLQLLNGN
jgi:amino acid adenylation domain-containing protein